MGRGRKREFDREEALDAAMRVFWRQGFLGAALSDLTAAMGINKPSLYAAFGNKEALFVEATEHYLQNYAKPHGTHLSAPGLSLRERVKAYLKSVVAGQCGARGELGCYISLCVTESAGDSLPELALEAVQKSQEFSEHTLRDFFQAEQKSGNLPETIDPGFLALRIITILHGTAALARGGRKDDEIAPLIEAFVNELIPWGD